LGFWGFSIDPTTLVQETKIVEAGTDDPSLSGHRGSAQAESETLLKEHQQSRTRMQKELETGLRLHRPDGREGLEGQYRHPSELLEAAQRR